MLWGLRDVVCVQRQGGVLGLRFYRHRPALEMVHFNGAAPTRARNLVHSSNRDFEQ